MKPISKIMIALATCAGGFLIGYNFEVSVSAASPGAEQSPAYVEATNPAAIPAAGSVAKSNPAPAAAAANKAEPEDPQTRRARLERELDAFMLELPKLERGAILRHFMQMRGIFKIEDMDLYRERFEALEPGETRTMLLGGLAGLWAPLDFAGFVEYSMNLEEPERKGIFRMGIGSTLQSDPHSVAQLVLNSDLDQEYKDDVQAYFFRNVSMFNYLSAANFLGDFGEDRITTDNLVQLAGNALHSGGPDSGLDLLERVAGTIPGKYAEAEAAVVRLWAADNPTEALAWVMQGESPLPGSVQAGFAKLAEKDPAAAQSWLASLTDPQVREAASNGFIEGIVNTSPTAAYEWIRDHEEARSDTALQAFARGVSRLDPAVAITWASEISDSAARAQMQEEIARMWAVRNKEAAAAWLAQSDFSRDQVETILSTTEQDLNRMQRGLTPTFRSRDGRYRYP